MEKSIKLARDFIRYQYFPYLLLIIGICTCSVYFVSFRNLSASQVCKVLEHYLIFTGIVLLTPLFTGEQDREIWNLEQSKKTSMWSLYLTRIFIAVASIAIVVTIFLLIFENSNSEVLYKEMWLGAVSELIFLGSIGFFVSAITNHVILGIMVSIMYYVANFGGDKYFKKLALFQMTKGRYDFSEYMFIAALALVITGIYVREYKK
jgi:MFS family permease